MPLVSLGKIVVPTAGTPVRLSATSQLCNAVYFTALSGQTGQQMYVGIPGMNKVTLAGVSKVLQKPGAGGGGGSLAVVQFVPSVQTLTINPVLIPNTGTTFSNGAGNLLVVGARAGGSATVNSATDLAGNTYTPLTAVVNSTLAVRFFYAVNSIASGANRISVNMSAGNSAAACLWEISGADLSAPFDVQASATGTGAVTLTTNAFTTTFANEIILGMMTDATNHAAQTYASNDGSVLDNAGWPGSPGTQLNNGAQHKIVSSIQTGVTASMTGNSGSGSDILVANTWKAAAGGGGGTGISDSFVMQGTKANARVDLSQVFIDADTNGDGLLVSVLI